MNYLRSVYFTACKLLFISAWLCLGSCVRENVAEDCGGSPVGLNITTRGITGTMQDGVTITSIRIIAADSHSGAVAFNKSIYDGLEDTGQTPATGNFKAVLRPGTYDVYVIGNETPAMKAVLSNIGNSNEMDLMKVQGSFDESDLVLLGKTKVRFRHKNDDPAQTSGQVLIDGESQWKDLLPVSLERIAAKVSLSIKKLTQNPQDHFTITKAELVQVPRYCYLLGEPYDGNNYQTIVFYDNSTGIHFADNSSIPVSVGNPVIIPENILSSPSNGNLAVEIRIYANYNGIDVVYKIPVRENLSVENYSLLRNSSYQIRATITQSGGIDYNPYIEYSVAEWTDAVEEDITIGGNIIYTGNWTPGTHIDNNTVGVYNNGYVEYKFNLVGPGGATWTATLSNGLDFAFDYSGSAVSSGIAGGGDKLIRIKPLRTVNVSGVATKFYISVNNNSTSVDIDLLNNTIMQIPQ